MPILCTSHEDALPMSLFRAQQQPPAVELTDVVPRALWDPKPEALEPVPYPLAAPRPAPANLTSVQV